MGKQSCSKFEEEDCARGVLIRYRWSHATSDLGPIRVKLITPWLLVTPLTFGVKANNAERWALVSSQWPSVDQTHIHKCSEGAQTGLCPERHTPQIMPLTNQYKRQERGWTLVLETCSVETGSPYRSVPCWSNILISKLNFASGICFLSYKGRKYLRPVE